MCGHLATLLGPAGLRAHRADRAGADFAGFLAGIDWRFFGSETRAQAGRCSLAQYRRRIHQREPWMEGTGQKKSEPGDDHATGQSTGAQGQRSHGDSLAAGVRPPRYRLVFAQRYCLEQAERHAGKRERPPDEITRVSVHADQIPELSIRCRGGARVGRRRTDAEPEIGLEYQHDQFSELPHRRFSSSPCRAVRSSIHRGRRLCARPVLWLRNGRNGLQPPRQTLCGNRVELLLHRGSRRVFAASPRSCQRLATTKSRL